MAIGNVLVLDSQGQNSLALSRSLGRKGILVTAGGNTRFLPGMLSKYTDGSYVHPDASTDKDAFVEHLRTHLAENDYDAVFAVTDLLTTVLSEHKVDLERTGTRVGVEDWETFLTANDKGRLFERMADVDVPTPDTFSPASLEEVEEIDRERGYDVVIKPRRTTIIDDSGGCHTNRIAGSNYVGVDEDLTERYREILDAEPSLRLEWPIVQEFVDGVETKCTVGLAEEGDLLACFQHKKYRVYPPSGGIGAIRQGTTEPRMKEHAERIVSELGWTGPVHVEFVMTADGEFYLIEVNGRYWGSLALTVNSGVDVPWLHYHQLQGTTPTRRVSGYRTDVKQRKLFYHDILWLRENLSNRRWIALLPFLASFATTREEMLDPEDPLPVLGLVPRSVNVLIDRQRDASVY
jgi:predicted ATP-grasp superfamily ATP-dependent carboligase